MSNVLVNKDKLDVLANAISNKSGEALTLTLDEMVSAVDGIETGGGGITPTGNIDITQAGVTDVTNYATATVEQGSVGIWMTNAGSGEFFTENNTRKWRIRGTAGVDVGDDVGTPGYIADQDFFNSKYYNYIAVPSGTTITPSSSSQTIGGQRYMMEGAVTVESASSVTPSVTAYENGDYVTQNSARKWKLEYGAGTVQEGWTDVGDVWSDSVYYDAIASGTSVTPTESSQTIGGANTMLEGAVTVNAIPSTYVGSGITQRDSTDLSANGATVTAPSGYYASNATTTIASGSASAPSTISGTSASVSTGTNTLTLSKTVSVTPTVSAGYVSSGTATNSSVSLTASVTTKGATNHYATTSDQTIASGTYLTGTQTIKALSQTNLSAENIKSGTTITINNGNANVWSVLGTYTGGGGTDKIPLLSTTSLGTLSTTSTSASDTGKSISLASSTNFTNYDMLIVSIGVDTHTNNRHLCSISFVFLTGTSNISTKNTYAVGSNVWNTKLGSTGTQSSRQSSTKYGIYPNSATVSNGTMSIPIYQRYNSNNTGTINGSYTARVYGVKLVDLVT